MQASPEKLTDEARALLVDPANILLLSAASSWEIAIKYVLGKLPIIAVIRSTSCWSPRPISTASRC